MQFISFCCEMQDLDINNNNAEQLYIKAIKIWFENIAKLLINSHLVLTLTISLPCMSKGSVKHMQHFNATHTLQHCWIMLWDGVKELARHTQHHATLKNGAIKMWPFSNLIQHVQHLSHNNGARFCIEMLHAFDQAGLNSLSTYNTKKGYMYFPLWQ